MRTPVPQRSGPSTRGTRRSSARRRSGCSSIATSSKGRLGASSTTWWTPSRVASPSTAAPRIERVLRHGPAAECLLQDAAGADLMVLGARGLDATDRSPLGRVGRHVLAAATCPVVVVPTETTAGAGATGRSRAGLAGLLLRGLRRLGCGPPRLAVRPRCGAAARTVAAGVAPHRHRLRQVAVGHGDPAIRRRRRRTRSGRRRRRPRPARPSARRSRRPCRRSGACASGRPPRRRRTGGR